MHKIGKMANQTKNNTAKALKLMTLLVLFLLPNIFYAQCAMCKAVVENGDSTMAEGINFGIVYLMIFPYLILALGIFLFVRNKKKKKVN